LPISEQGVEASTNLYSMIETAKTHNLNPEKYLNNNYRQLPSVDTIKDFNRLLP
jgi:hypothetical protein